MSRQASEISAREISVDEMVDLEEATHEETMQSTRKRLARDPDGNLYRGWAVGIQKGYMTFMMTLMVMLVQLTGPIVMTYWGHANMASGVITPTWNYIQTDPNATVPTEGADATVSTDNGFMNKDKFFAVQMKVLGTALMLLIFFNGEQLLDRQDRQTDRLRFLYPLLKRPWMITDAFCNSWCVAACSLATPFLVFTSETAKDLVLDAFGLLFLATLDEYSASIEFGIESSDFDEIIDNRELQLGITEESMNPKFEALELDEISETANQSWEYFWERFAYGDMCFSIARQVNLVAGCISVPAYILTRWEPAAANIVGAPPAPTWPLRDTFFAVPVLACAACLIVLAHIPFVIDFAQARDHDCMGFMFIVLFRGRGDPRRADRDADGDDL